MGALMGLGWRSVIQMDKAHAMLKLNTQDELLIDVSTNPYEWDLRYQGKHQPWIEYPSDLPKEIINHITKLISLYNAALQDILDEITDWRAFQ